MERAKVGSLVSLLQGTFYIVTGAWPIVHYQSFERVTGPKEDDWLVKTTGALIAVIGAALAVAGVRGQPVRAETSVLGISAAAGLAGSDLIFASTGRIPRIYLLDAISESGILALWAISLIFSKQRR